MELSTLKSLLDPKEREDLYLKILNKLEEIGKYEYFTYQKFKISEGVIPVVSVGKTSDLNEPTRIKNSPTKPFKPGKPIEESEVNKNTNYSSIILCIWRSRISYSKVH